MTLLTPPAFEQAGTYSALLDRMHLITTQTMRDVSQNHRAREGFYPDRFPAFTNPSAFNWVIGACAGVIANDFATDGGDYRFSNPSQVSGSFGGSSPTLNRNDILGFQVKDNFYDASGLNQVAPAVLVGANSAGTPADPAIPAGFLPVARAVINAASSTPIMQDLRAKTVLGGAVLPVESAAIRSALGSQHAGMTVWRTDTAVHEVADGAGGWRTAGLVAATSAADLTAKVSSPYVGQLAHRSDTGRYYRWTGGVWAEVNAYFHGWQDSTSLQNIPNVTNTAIIMNQEIADDLNGHSGGLNPTRYTPPIAGKYLCTGQVAMSNTAAGPFLAQFRRNGARVLGAANYSSEHAVNQGQVANTCEASATLDMNGTTDYIELWVFHAFGATTSTFSTATEMCASYMIIERVG